MYKNIKNTIKNNLKVIENYSFMTVLQIINVAIGLIVFPYIIRVFGTEIYGKYVFAFSFITILGTFIRFSFGLLATKEIAQNLDDLQKKSEIVSSVVFARIFLFVVAFIILLLASLFSNFVAEYFGLYLVCFLGNLSAILFHKWYFQGIQKMKVVTYINVVCQLLSLPFIFLSTQ
ncbi:MAG: oligosaccharide flippase family protein [Flavobacteriaceae bacterium]|nr:oligosaccharide flippase family protein [Flavobacteriaceae bacterium]